MEHKRQRTITVTEYNEEELKIIHLGVLSRSKQEDFSKMGQPLIRPLLNSYALNKFNQEAKSIWLKYKK